MGALASIVLWCAASLPPSPIVAVLEDEAGDLSAAELRRELQLELGREVLSSDDERATGSSELLVFRVTRAGASVLYLERTQGRSLQRALQLPREPEAALTVLTLIAGNLSRNEAGELARAAAPEHAAPALEADQVVASTESGQPDPVIPSEASPERSRSVAGQEASPVNLQDSPVGEERSTWEVHVAPGAGFALGFGTLLVQAGLSRRFSFFAVGAEVQYGYVRSTWGVPLLRLQPYRALGATPEHSGSLTITARVKRRFGRMGLEAGIGIGPLFFTDASRSPSLTLRQPALLVRVMPAVTLQMTGLELYLQPEVALPTALQQFRISLAVGARWWVL